MEDGKDYFARKVKYLGEQIEKIQVLATEKTRIRDTIIEVIEIKATNAAKAAAKTWTIFFLKINFNAFLITLIN